MEMTTQKGYEKRRPKFLESQVTTDLWHRSFAIYPKSCIWKLLETIVVLHHLSIHISIICLFLYEKEQEMFTWTICYSSLAGTYNWAGSCRDNLISQVVTFSHRKSKLHRETKPPRHTVILSAGHTTLPAGPSTSSLPKQTHSQESHPSRAGGLGRRSTATGPWGGQHTCPLWRKTCKKLTRPRTHTPEHTFTQASA